MLILESHKTLGLLYDEHVTRNDIRQAYFKKSLRYHPDKNRDNADATKQMQDINEAYKTLMDAEKRDIYDKFGKQGLENQGMSVDPSDILKNLFGMNVTNSDMHSEDIPAKCYVNVTYEDLYKGKTVKQEVERKSLCKVCKGTGNHDKKKHACKTCGGDGHITRYEQIAANMMRQVHDKCIECYGTGTDTNVKKCKECGGKKYHLEKAVIDIEIPPGAWKGMPIKIPNAGNQTSDNLRSHVIVQINELPSELYERRSVFPGESNPAHITMTIKLSMAEAICGFRKTIHHFDGYDIILDDKNKTITEKTVYVFPDKGLPLLKGKGRGDLFVKFDITTPQYTHEQKLKIWKSMTKTPYNPDKSKNTDDEVHADYMTIQDYIDMRNNNIHTNFNNNFETNSDDETYQGGQDGQDDPNGCHHQ